MRTVARSGEPGGLLWAFTEQVSHRHLTPTLARFPSPRFWRDSWEIVCLAGETRRERKSRGFRFGLKQADLQRDRTAKTVTERQARRGNEASCTIGAVVAERAVVSGGGAGLQCHGLHGLV